LTKLGTTRELVDGVQTLLNSSFGSVATIEHIQKLQEALTLLVSEKTKNPVTIQQTTEQKDRILKLIYEIPTICEIHQMLEDSAIHHHYVILESHNVLLSDHKQMYDALKDIFDNIPNIDTHT
jgi:hypothetical protein